MQIHEGRAGGRDTYGDSRRLADVREGGTDPLSFAGRGWGDGLGKMVLGGAAFLVIGSGIGWGIARLNLKSSEAAAQEASTRLDLDVREQSVNALKGMEAIIEVLSNGASYNRNPKTGMIFFSPDAIPQLQTDFDELSSTAPNAMRSREIAVLKGILDGGKELTVRAMSSAYQGFSARYDKRLQRELEINRTEDMTSLHKVDKPFPDLSTIPTQGE